MTKERTSEDCCCCDCENAGNYGRLGFDASAFADGLEEDSEYNVSCIRQMAAELVRQHKELRTIAAQRDELEAKCGTQQQTISNLQAVQDTLMRDRSELAKGYDVARKQREALRKQASEFSNSLLAVLSSGGVIERI